MFSYHTPGVYFEWQDISVPRTPIQRTDIAGFVGIAVRGPLHTPVKVQSWSQFTSVFGEHTPQGYLAYAVEGFFANGGQTCWVVRVANPDPQQSKPGLLTLMDDMGNETLRLIAASPGVWSQDLIVTVLRTSETRFTFVFRLLSGAQEVWSNLTMNAQHARYAAKIINDEVSGSSWLRLEDLNPNSLSSGNPPNAKADNLINGTARLCGGKDGLDSLEINHITGEGAPIGQCWGLACLEQIDGVAIVAIPDIMPKANITPAHKPPKPADCTLLVPPPLAPIKTLPSCSKAIPLEFPPSFKPGEVNELQNAVVRHCERLKDRIAILDSHSDDVTPEQVINNRREGFSTSYAGLYYPWIGVHDPLTLDGLLRQVPPSGHIAGVYARSDLDTGVHKPPANAVMEQAKTVVTDIDDMLHGILNDAQVNVIRNSSGRGIRVSGARTLSEDADYKYINVRRLLAMIAESIDEKAQALVFEPNNHDLWQRIEQIVGAFLDQLWRAGMLDGATADEAYSVRCDAETNPPQEQDAGRVLCEIGVLLPWPAEFVVIRIGFTESGATILEGGP